MRKGDKAIGVWGLIVVLVVVVSAFCWAAGSEEAGAYKVGAYSEQDGSLFNITEPNEVTNLSWVDRIHNKIHSDTNININANETDVADVTYDNVSILRKSDVTPLDANNNKIEDSLELRVSNVRVPKIDVIVLYNRSVDLAAIDYSPIGAEIKYDYSVINATAITIPCNGLYELPKIQNVKMVYEDHEVQAYLDSSVPVIKADTARTTYNVTGSNVTIAVIDTGIDDAHESLDDMDDNPATTNPKVIGFKDFVNFYPDPYDDYGHGTHCAGIAAGTGGSSVYKGVAPGAKLVGVKVLNAWGSGSESTVIAGIDWAVQNKDDYGIKIISMSLGRDYNNDGTTPMALACDAAVGAGIVVSVAAGNAGMWGSKTVGDPACAKKVITVGAIDDDMDIAYFSSRGPTADGRIKPEVCAVGVDVTSAEAETGNGYVPHSGTSMSTPHVAGVAALMLEYNPNLAPLEVREILMDTAVDRGVIGPDNDYGWGVVDAMFALLLSVPQEHDIKVSDLQAPDYVKPNDTALVNATVCNIGMNNETDITVELIVNDTVLNNTTIPFVENGTNTSVYFTWSAPSIEGMYNLTVYAVPVLGENITLNNQKTKRVSVTSAKPIALFKDRDPWGYASNEEVLLKYGLPYTVFTSSDIGSVNLSDYGKIVIASQQPYPFYFKIEQNRPWFEAYISNGSIFELHGAEWSSDDWSGLVMPGGFTSMLDLSNDVTVNMPNHVILKYPNVITAAELDWWNYATHGWLTNFSIKPIKIITQEPTKNPCLVEFPYGDGYIVATMQTLEWAYAHEYSPFLENVILYLPVRQEHDILVGITVPEVLKFNETNIIGANVWNIGLSDETDVAVDFIINGTVLESKTIPFIQNGTDTIINFNWTPTAVGWYNVSVYATPVPGEDYFKNNLATRYVEVPKAVLTGVYADYGIDLDDDGLYNYLAIEVGVNVAEEGYYYLYGDIETLNGFYITDAKNDTHLSVGKQNITLLFNGIDIRRVDLNGPYTLSNLRLRDNYWNTLDKRLKAYNTSFYNSKEFQLPKVMFTDVYNDTGVDTDNDTFYNYLSIDIGVNVSESGYYHWYGELYDSYGYEIAYEGNSTYLENGTQIIKLNFKGLEIYMHGVDGPYYLKYLMLYDDDYARQDCRHDAHTTYVYNYTDFQRPPAEFNDVYTDNGTDTDGDGLYNYLIIDVGVDVRSAGYYRVEGRLDDNFGNYVEWRSNYTYLNTGNQTVQLDFDGIKIRQNGVNGTFDLRYLHLYNTTDWIQLDYRYYAHTTSHYNWTDFQKPPAEFTDIYLDYGGDTDGDSLNNSLVIEVGVNVTKAGTYRVRGKLYENATYHYIISAYNTTYLDTGNHNVLLKFDGLRLRQNKYNGTYDLKYLYLYNYSYPVPPPTPTPTPVSASQLEKSEAIEVENVSVQYGEQLDYRYYAYTTGYYEWSGWQKPPAEFTDIYADNGVDDADEDELYNYLVINVGVNIRDAGNYRVSGFLYETGTYQDGGGGGGGAPPNPPNPIDYDSNTTYLSEENQTVQLRFEGIKIRNNEYNGTYDLRYLELYNATYPYPTPTPTPASQLESKSTEAENISVRYGEQLDYRYYAYTTSRYNYTEFQTIPPCYTYTKEYVTYDWDAISTPEQNWTGCDDCSYNYVLPWNFTFFCENHSSIQISTNGLITFPPDTSSHCCSPDLENTVAIAPFWGDLSQACGEGTNISVQDKGDRVVVVWYTGTCGGGCLNKDLFEVILYETGKIRFNYNYLNNIPKSVGAGISNGIVYYTNTWGNSISVVYSPINLTDLIIEHKWEEWINESNGTYVVWYTIHNIGTANASARHNTSLTVDGVLIEYKEVSVELAPCQNFTDNFTTILNLSGQNDEIAVQADCNNTIDELNEANNNLTNVWPPLPPPPLPVHNLNTGLNYSTIQAAIYDSNTTVGHTITVDAGTYTENVDVTKSLTIRSTSGNPADTIVNASNPNDHVFEVTADYVNIRGFTVNGATGWTNAGIYLGSGVGHCNISNNNASNNRYGIYLFNSTGNNLTSNEVSLNEIYGIFLTSSSNRNIISKNNVSENKYKVYHNSGIFLEHVFDNTIVNNNVSHNEGFGIFVMWGNDTSVMIF